MRYLIAAAIVMAAMFGARDAQAHRLRIFATVEAGAISGYAYFVGGGRARGASVVFRDASESELHRMQADDRGVFSWTPPKPQTIRITVDAGDGHAGSLTISAKRFSAIETGASEQIAHEAGGGSPAAPDSADIAVLEKRLEARMEAAISRQLRPLLEAQEAAQARLRFSDIIAGLGLIAGMAGTALWLAARGRKT
ncbi:MAG: cobalamin biosynthesis protein CbiM [Alphaproteobacteria bacterium]|nr:cobalamin biosynthesis protein CbiM [Alphaproteobacteria bacterium]